jgi:cytochrome b561
MFQSEPTQYTRTAKWLHWLVALLVILQFVSHFMIDQFSPDDPAAGPFKLMHGSGGLLILILMLVRTFWRWRNPPPPLAETTPAWQRMASSLVHKAFYVLLIAQPITGMIAANNEKIGPLHGLLSAIIFGLALIHVGAALWHHFVQRDTVLRRMLPGKGA